MPIQSTYPGTSDTWNGFERSTFTLEGIEAYLIKPTSPLPGKPWIWRARWFDICPFVDIALLGKGFHLAYIDVVDLYGSQTALQRFDMLYTFLVSEQKLSAKVVLEGFSRGALPVINWGAKNADKICCIYLDAPVCDITSWPGGQGAGIGSPGEWQDCLKALGVAENQAPEINESFFRNLITLARHDIPIICVCSEGDDVVPYNENAAILEKSYKESGGTIKSILKPGGHHQLHSLENPAPIVDFILEIWDKQN